MKNLFSFLLVLVALATSANNLQIKNVALVDNDPVAKTVMIQFDISWDHSWHDDINWDAAWVFAKFFDGDLPYHHCKLDLNGAVLGIGTTHELIVPQDSLELDGTYYGVGAFIYRDVLGDGTFDADVVQLKWSYGLNGIEELPEDIEVQVYGTEMVYIPEGPFAFGDGYYGWHIEGTPNYYVYISDYLSPLMEFNFSYSNNYRRVHGICGLDIDGDGEIDNPNFPTGYKAFYIMKYETTQGLYTDFLNTLTGGQISDADLFQNTSSYKYKYAITNIDGNYGCTNPDRACNYFKDQRTMSLADWIALRPMTELEFEKAARGPLAPVENEMAWGADYSTAVQIDTISFPEDGSETPLYPDSSNFHNGYFVFFEDGSYAGDGPLRSGLFAREDSDRVLSGGSYYGVMDLSGILQEFLICMIGNFYNNGFQPTNGDGDLDVNGFSDSFFNPYTNSYLSSMANFGRSNKVSSVNTNLQPHFSSIRYVRNAPVLP